VPLYALRNMFLEPFLRGTPIFKERAVWCSPTGYMGDSDLESDSELLRLMMAGDESGFLRIYRKHHPGLHRFCLRLSGSPPVADEVTQETFLAFIQAPRNYDSARGPLILYLFGIARRLAWKTLRKERLFSSLEDHEPELGEVATLPKDPAQQQELERMRRAILALPPKYREAIVLCALQELSYEEAAGVIKCSVGTIRSRVHRAKHFLVRKLTEHGARKRIREKNSLLGYDL
jgi:RNA polymerase sigma factor (sigma-70 family)